MSIEGGQHQREVKSTLSDKICLFREIPLKLIGITVVLLVLKNTSHSLCLYPELSSSPRTHFNKEAFLCFDQAAIFCAPGVRDPTLP